MIYNFRIFHLFTVLIAVFFVSCECVPDINTPKVITPDQYANILFSNCNSNFDLLKFKTDGGNVFNSYYLENKSIYQQVIPGLANVNIFTYGDSVLFNSVMDLQKAKPYTFIAFGSQDRVQGMMLDDTIAAYSNSNAYFRCVNLANESPYIMFKVNGTYSIPIVQPFRSSSKFYPTYSGVYNIEILNATTDSLMMSYRNLTLLPGIAYTFVLRGYFTGFGNEKLNLWIIESDFLMKSKKE